MSPGGRGVPGKEHISDLKHIWKGRDFTTVEVYERVGKSVISVDKTAQKG